MDFPKTRYLVNPKISHPVRTSMTSEKSENSHRNKKRDLPKNKREKRATLKKDMLDTAGFESETRGSISEIMFRIGLNVCLCSCVCYFDGLLFSLFFCVLSFFEFFFYKRSFFTCEFFFFLSLFSM